MTDKYIVKKFSEFTKITDPVGATFAGFKTGVGDIQIDFSDMTPLFKVSQVKGQSIVEVPSLKLFTDESNNIRKKFTNVSIDQDNFVFTNKTAARSSIPTANRSLGTTICYRTAIQEPEEYTYLPSSIQGSAVLGDTGAILTGIVNSQRCTITVTGYNTINLQIQNNSPGTAQHQRLGGAFFDANNSFISGYIFYNTEVANGDRKDITIPSNAVRLEHTYVSNAWASANGVAVLGNVTLKKIAITDETWFFERFEGTNVSTWLNDTYWKDISTGLSNEKGQSEVIAPTLKLFTEEGDYLRKSLLNISLENNKYDYASREEARAAVNMAHRGRGSIVSYKLLNTEGSTTTTITPTATEQGKAILGTTGTILISANNQYFTIDVAGYSNISLRCMGTNYEVGGAFFNSSGVFISGFIFPVSDFPEGSGIKTITIPNDAASLKQSYATDAWCDANGVERFGSVTLVSGSEENGWITERFIGDNLNNWIDNSNWEDFGKEIEEVTGGLINITHPLNGKKISILGDSISTFLGTTPSGYEAPVYPTGDVDTLGKLWWSMLLEETHGILGSANAISGSCITDSNVSTRPSFINEQRLTSLGSPDVILVFGGTNDFGSTYKRPIGSYNWGGTQDKTVFAQAMTQLCSRLNTLYPNSRIVFMTPIARRDAGYTFPYKLSGTTGYLYEYSDTIKKVCDVFNIPVIDLSDCGITYENANLYLLPDLIHPKASGMRLISDYVKSALVPILNSTNLIVSNNYVTPNDIQEGSLIERINKAVAHGLSTGKRVVIPKFDTVANSDIWLIDSAILLPSNIHIELDNCRIKLSNTCRDNHFRTNNLAVGQSTIDLRENIHIKGIGNAILEGADNPRSTGDWNKVLTTNSTLGSWSSYGTDAGKAGQNQYGGWLNYSVIFCNTKNFSFSGVRFVEPHAWSMAIDNSSFGVVENIIINASGGRTINGTFQYFKNQGAIIAVQGCRDLIFRNISGNNSDDIMMVGCLLVPSTSQYAASHSTGNQNTHSPSGDVYRGMEDDTYNITIQDIMADATVSGVNYALIKFTPSYLQKQYNIVVERLYSVAANKITFDYYNGTNPVIGAGKGTNKAYTLRDIKSNIRIVSNNGGEVRDSLFENIVYSGSGDPIGISKDASYNNIFEKIRNITL